MLTNSQEFCYVKRTFLVNTLKSLGNLFNTLLMTLSKCLK